MNDAILDSVIASIPDNTQIANVKNLVAGYTPVETTFIGGVVDEADITTEIAFRYIDDVIDIEVVALISTEHKLFSFILFNCNQKYQLTSEESNIIMTKLHERITGERNFIFIA